MEEEHRRALEEEAMEQVGRPEHLEEEHDPSPEEQDREWTEQRERKEARLAAGEVHAVRQFLSNYSLAYRRDLFSPSLESSAKVTEFMVPIMHMYSIYFHLICY